MLFQVNHVKNPKNEIPQKSVPLESHCSMQLGGHDITNSPFPQQFFESTFKTTEILLTGLKKRRGRIFTKVHRVIKKTVPV
jgi:hypothetical protein